MEERANWKDRIASARSGLFMPPSLQTETIAMPGARGGANWGTTAAVPQKGLVFISAQDWPSVYKLSLNPPSPARGPGEALNGQALYAQVCQACHGADRAGSNAFPSLVGFTRRLGAAELRQIVVTGKGEMPAFPNLDGSQVDMLFSYLAGLDSTPQAGRNEVRVLSPESPPSFGGPVVASGGAPGGLEITAGQFGGMVGPPYPEGIEVPENRYYTGYGLEFAHLLSPPWSSLVAYDLNKGTIAWRVPLGDDAEAAKEGRKNTGMLAGGEHHGMVVTSTGLLFIATRDGKLRAFDQDNGRVLWTANLPGGSEGIPAMYEVGGRQYLVVQASSSLMSGRRPTGQPLAGDPSANPDRGYVVFALPAKK
jgi:quinoprotein glucose dehydrogenase